MTDEELMKIVDIEMQGITIEDCFHFLGCKSTDTIDNIRKIFYYKLQTFCFRYSTIREYFKKMNWTSVEKQRELDFKLRENALYHRLISDSYLAILLYKSQNNSYEYIMKGLSCYFKYSGWNSENIYPILDNEIKENSKEIVLYPAIQYFDDLLYNNQFGTNEGLFQYTSSILSVILFERDRIKPDDSVKVLTFKSPIEYSDIRIKDKD